MSNPYQNITNKQTPQREPVFGRQDQVANSEGGYVFQLDDFKRLDRFLILGSEGGTYYIGEQKLTKQNAEVVLRCIAQDTSKTVQQIVSVSQSGRAPKNSPALFALALVATHADDKGRKEAREALNKVARTGTHLFEFIGYYKQFRGIGRGIRTAISNWYLDKTPEQLAYQLVKYRQRAGFTHRDVLRIAHPKPEDPWINDLLNWTTGHTDWVEDPSASGRPRIIEGFETAQVAELDQIAHIIRDYPNLPREALPTESLNRPDVWQALLENGMPMTALVRNLGNMSKVGLLTPMSDAEAIVTRQLSDVDQIRKSRIHPLQILTAMKTYASGRGYRGSGSWPVVASVVDALDAAFYIAFGNVESSGKRTLLALDVSSSMTQPIANMNITASEGSVAMAMVTAAAEQQFMCVGFTSQSDGWNWRANTGLTILPFTSRQRLDDLVRETQQLTFGGTDCSLPMIAALQQGWKVETFIIYTDSETWAGKIHPYQALNVYREKTGIPAKLIVVGMTSNGFSIADPRDPGMLDVVGFDTSVPSVITDFSKS